MSERKAKASAKSKRKSLALQITDRDPASNLQRAVIRWLESKGCPPLVVGSVCTIQMPDERDLNFYVAVKCLGHKPEADAP